MRRVLYSDVDCVARTLMNVPDVDRETTVENIFDRAHAADKYRKRIGKIAHGCGDGRLAAACDATERVESGRLSDPEYRKCFTIILNYMNKK